MVLGAGPVSGTPQCPDEVFKVSLHSGHLTPVDRWKTESKEHIRALKMVGSGGDGSSPWSTLVQRLASQFLMLLRDGDWVALPQSMRAALGTCMRQE